MELTRALPKRLSLAGTQQDPGRGLPSPHLGVSVTASSRSQTGAVTGPEQGGQRGARCRSVPVGSTYNQDAAEFKIPHFETSVGQRLLFVTQIDVLLLL